jgi:hypothetical protein
MQADTTEGTVKRIVTGAVSSMRAKGEAVGAVRAKRRARAIGKSRGKEPELTKGRAGLPQHLFWKMTVMENGMPMASANCDPTVASLGRCVRHAKTPDLYMSQEMCALGLASSLGSRPGVQGYLATMRFA